MARKLKVFSWSDGLHDYTVATTSRAKALDAWDVGRDLFKDGTAKEISEGPAHDAALDAPETVVTTPAGGLGAALKALPASARRKPSKAETARAEKLAALKADLEAVEDEAEASELAFAERRSALDAEEAAAMEDFEARRTALVKAIRATRK
jgi:glycerol-3-phosphate dehydrogenase